MPHFLSIIFAIVVCLAFNVDAREISLYVSPNGDDSAQGTSPRHAFATLERARDAIRELKQNGKLHAPVTVFLREGLHPRTRPLLLTESDSGSLEAPITYTAYKNEKPVGIWITEIPEVKNGSWTFNQLFVNGELRRRARTPNQGFYRVAGFPDGGQEVHYHTDCQRFEFKEGDLNPQWTNLTMSR